MPNINAPDSPSPEQAMHRLIEGNRRFLDEACPSSIRGWDQKLSTANQRPFAIILGCSDSRTPVEIVFDQGFGDLFVVRLAGNVVAPSVVGSIEFAASQFGSRLVVVMGHTRCGAIAATLTSIQTGRGPESRNLRDITDRIAPHIEGLVGKVAPEHLARDAMRANVRASANHLRHGSQLLEDLVQAGRIAIVGAEYELETGVVNFLDAVPPPSASV